MSSYSSAELADRTIHRRAVEVAIWGVPAVNFELMRLAMSPEPDMRNQFVYWSGLLDWHNQTLTPNPDLIYYMMFMDLQEDGPVVIEIPSATDTDALNGNICTLWQMPLEDVGKFGADKGEGGKYLIVPPGYEGEIPDEGYFVLRSDTFQNYALFRSVLSEGTQAALDRGLNYCHLIKAYPLSEAQNPPATIARDMQGRDVVATITYDSSFFEHLDRVIQSEDWLPRDRAVAEMATTIGITKGRRFTPDDHVKNILDEAAGEAHAYLASAYENDVPRFYGDGGSQWIFPASSQLADAQARGYANLAENPFTSRGVVYHMAYIGLKRLGAGQFYLVSLRDGDGHLLESAKTYRMRVPAEVPVSQYWSVAMYDAESHAFIAHNDKYGVSSQTPGLRVNDDGTTDVFFGPEAVDGWEANSVMTGSSTGFELMFRFYGTKPEIFDKTWQLSDVELITEQGR